MGFDSISNAPLPALNKDFSKKKRTNRLAKLKQSKLDVRREQWLSQVKNKERKMDSIGKRESPQSPLETVVKEKSLDSLESNSRGEETESSSIHDSDMESLMSSPIGSSLEHSDSSKAHSGSSNTSIHDSDIESLMSSPIGSSNSSKGHSSNSSTSSGYCSGSVSEEEEDDDCLDNWETMADALDAKEVVPEPNPVPNSPARKENKPVSDIPKTDCPEVVGGPDLNRRAWSSDDAFRPQTLPNLLKQRSFVMNSDRQCSHGAINRAWKSVMSQPSSCPICCEDLDVTDTSFLPCLCGFRLCLFCHKRILEADARCPGCRKHYDPLSGNTGFNGGLSPLRMVRSCSMSSRS